MTRHYSNVAAEAILATGVANGTDTSIEVDTTVGFPSTTPFVLAVDFGVSAEELVEVTGVSGTVLTVNRGFDGTPAVSHDAGAVVRHVHAAIDFREPQEHIAATNGVHGATGEVVGTTDAQVLTNKDLTGGSNTFPSSLVTLTGAQTLTNKTLTTPTITEPTINGVLEDDTGWEALGEPSNAAFDNVDAKIRRTGNRVWLDGRIRVNASAIFGNAGNWVLLWALDAQFHPSGDWPLAATHAISGDAAEAGATAPLLTGRALTTGNVDIVNTGTDGVNSNTHIQVSGTWLVD